MGWEPLPDPAEWVDRYGDLLYRYALARVADPEVARDLVQETLVAGLRNRESFGGRSDPRTWLVGILRHKILDHFRRTSREALDDGADPEAEAFGADGRWRTPLGWMADPARLAEGRGFWQALVRCLRGVPPRQAAAFVLRELEGLDTEALCQEMGITPTNAWVLLHRARLALRRCLAEEGFGGEESETP
ncbi:sigma-70 family RNA polymerase sigma factor [Deferrisoma palaeochoriense]